MGVIGSRGGAPRRSVRRHGGVSAEELGDAGLAGSIRQLNQLAAGEQPEVGQLLVLPPPTVPQVEQDAFLTSVVGEIAVTPPGGSPQRAQAFVSIPTGSRVCTQGRSYGLLRVATSCDGDDAQADDVVLWADTCVRLDSVVASVQGRATVLTVEQGSVVIAEPDANDQGNHRVSVVAGSGVAVGAGGFRVHLEPDQALRAEALTAELAVLGGGEELVLQAGEGVRVPLQGVPTGKVDLLGAGPLRAPGPREPLRRPSFAWQPQAEAFGYLFTISADARGVRVVYQEPTPDSVHAPGRLLLPVEPGQPLWWRVATLDELGFLGVPTASRPFGTPGGG